MSDGTQLSMILDLQRDILKLEKGESFVNDKVAYLLKEQDKIKQREQSRTGNLDHFVQENNKTIKDLKHQVNILDERADRHVGYVQDNNKTCKALRGKVDILSTRVDSNYEYIRANNKTCKELQGELAINKQLILDVKATACAQAEQIEGLEDGERKLYVALAVRDDRIAALTKRVTDLENLSNRVEFSFPKLKGRISDLENEVILDIERTKCAFAKVKHDIAKLVGMVPGVEPYGEWIKKKGGTYREPTADPKPLQKLNQVINQLYRNEKYKAFKKYL